MFPNSSAVHNGVRDLELARQQTRAAGGRLRSSVRRLVVSPPFLAGTVLAGFVAARSAGRPRLNLSGGMRALRSAAPLLSLLRLF